MGPIMKNTLLKILDTKQLNASRCLNIEIYKKKLCKV